MEITLRPELESALDALVEATGRDRSDLVNAAVERLLEREHRLAWLRAEIQIGLDEIERGEGIPITPESMRQLADEICREGREELARRKQTA